LTNPYRPPSAPVADPDAPAVLTVRRLMRGYQALVVATTLLGLVLNVGLLQVFATPDMALVQGANGAGAILPFDVSDGLYVVMRILWIVSGIGLFFFTWWGRWVFIGTYLLSVFTGLTSGVQVWLPWDVLLFVATTLMDGAILALSFLPPISGYFARARSAG